MNISVNITPNIPKPNPNPMLSAVLLDMRFYILPNLLPIQFSHEGAGVAFAGNVCIAAGVKVCVKLVIRLIPGIAYYGNDILNLLRKVIFQFRYTLTFICTYRQA